MLLSWLRSLACLLISVPFAVGVHAAYPEKPIKLVVPFAPGGVTDNIARTVAASVAQALGQPVVIDNRPGAGGTLAAAQVARAPADGYTLLLGSIGMLAIAPGLGTAKGYDWQTSFVPVVHLSTTPNLIVAHPSLGIVNVKELMSLARAKPGTLAFASSGQATSTHLSGALFEAMAGIRLNHVPYRGSAPALADVLAAHVPLMFDTFSVVASIKAGKLKAWPSHPRSGRPCCPRFPP